MSPIGVLDEANDDVQICVERRSLCVIPRQGVNVRHGQP